jgi:hypothetical protein
MCNSHWCCVVADKWGLRDGAAALKTVAAAARPNHGELTRVVEIIAVAAGRSLRRGGIGPCLRRILCAGIAAVTFVAMTLRHDGGAKSTAEVVRKFIKVGVAVNLDGHLGRIANDVAVVAPLEVVF